MQDERVLAKSLMFAGCGHVQNEAGNVCYESLLLKGQHIGTSFDSSNSDLSEKMAMMEGVPFIIAKDKQLFVMPPSEALIRSKEMPESQMNLLLDLLAKSMNGKDQKAENKRISKKERAQNRNAQKNKVGRPFSKKIKYQTE